MDRLNGDSDFGVTALTALFTEVTVFIFVIYDRLYIQPEYSS